MQRAFHLHPVFGHLRQFDIVTQHARTIGIRLQPVDREVDRHPPQPRIGIFDHRVFRARSDLDPHVVRQFLGHLPVAGAAQQEGTHPIVLADIGLAQGLGARFRARVGTSDIGRGRTFQHPQRGPLTARKRHMPSLANSLSCL